jgi:hypothetical protein
VVTTSYIPTVGEHAERALAGFAALQEAVDLPPQQRLAAARPAAIKFVRACLALMRKFPAQARLDFASGLPFTSLELELIGRGHLEDAPIADAITLRLLKWVSRGSTSRDDTNAHAADFLIQLTPHLDLWSQRQQATAAAERLVHV